MRVLIKQFTKKVILSYAYYFEYNNNNNNSLSLSFSLLQMFSLINTKDLRFTIR